MKLAFFLTVIIFIFCACKKNQEDKVCIISKVIGTNSLSVYPYPDSSITVINYNQNKIVSSVERINPGKVYERLNKLSFEYNGEQLRTVRRSDNTNEIYWDIQYNADNTFKTINYSWGHKMDYYYADGKLTKISYRHVTNSYGLGEYDIDFIYSNGNVIKATEIWLASGAINTWLFDYIEKSNTIFKDQFFPNYLSFSENYTLAYTLSRNLVSKVESSGGGKSVFKYTITDQAKVSSVTEVFTNTVNSYTKKATYEYLCK